MSEHRVILGPGTHNSVALTSKVTLRIAVAKGAQVYLTTETR